MSERALAILAVACAIPYWLGILLFLSQNRRRPAALLIAGGAAVCWPLLFFCSVMQLVFVIPVFTIYFLQGLDLSKGLSRKAAWCASVLTIAFLLITGAWALLADV